MLTITKPPSLSKILPQSIVGDEKIQAAAKVLDAELEKLNAQIKLTMHLARLDELPHEVLDHLAYQYHVDFYSPTTDIEIKRNLIRETIFWHRIKGTPAAVEKILKDVLVDAEVVENWEYGGEAFYFKIVSKGLSKFFGDDGIKLMKLIDAAKNVRSWLEDLTFDFTLENPDTYYIATAEEEGGDVFVDCFDGNVPQKQDIFCAACELEGGEIFTDCELSWRRENIYHRVFELEAGEVVTDVFFTKGGEIEMPKLKIEVLYKDKDGELFKKVLQYINPNLTDAQITDFVYTLNSLTTNTVVEIIKVINSLLEKNKPEGYVEPEELQDILDGKFVPKADDNPVTESDIQLILSGEYENKPDDNPITEDDFVF